MKVTFTCQAYTKNHLFNIYWRNMAENSLQRKRSDGVGFLAQAEYRAKDRAGWRANIAAQRMCHSG